MKNAYVAGQGCGCDRCKKPVEVRKFTDEERQALADERKLYKQHMWTVFFGVDPEKPIGRQFK